MSKLTNLIRNMFKSENIKDESMVKENELDKHFNELGLTKENKEKEANNYLDSKDISVIDRNKLKNDKEFLSLLEDKLMTEYGIQYIREQINELKYDFTELTEEDGRLKVMDNIGSNSYNKTLEKLENKLENEENHLNKINNSLDKITGKDEVELSSISDLIDKASKRRNSIADKAKPLDLER